MSAGSGVVHPEPFDAASGQTRFIQTWVLPDEPGGATTYSSAAAELAGEWLPVVSCSHPDAATRISASGATLYAARLAAGERVEVPETPLAHLFVTTGSAVLDDTTLGEGDAVRLRTEGGTITASAPTELPLWPFADARKRVV